MLLVCGLEIALVQGLPENFEPPRPRDKFHIFQ